MAPKYLCRDIRTKAGDAQKTGILREALAYCCNLPVGFFDHVFDLL